MGKLPGLFKFIKIAMHSFSVSMPESTGVEANSFDVIDRKRISLIKSPSICNYYRYVNTENYKNLFNASYVTHGGSFDLIFSPSALDLSPTYNRIEQLQLVDV